MTVQLAPRMSDPLPTLADVRFTAERLQDRVAIDALIDAAFGPGRFAKTSERVREQASPRIDLSVCAWTAGDVRGEGPAGESLIGAVRQTPIRIGDTPALFFGPIATRADHRGHGVGAALTQVAGEVGAKAGETLVLLIGAIDFFRPLGFERVPMGRVSLAWPTDYARLLWRPLQPGAQDGVAGRLSPRP